MATNTKKKRPSARKVWSHVLREMLTKNKSDSGPVRDYNLYASSNAIYSNLHNVMYMYTIDQYPDSIPINLHKEIRNYAEGNVRVSFVTPLEPTTIDWGSASMRSRLNSWRRARDDSDSENVDEFNIRDNQSKIDSMDRRKDTLFYLADAEGRRKRKLFIQRSIMFVSGTRGENFDHSVESILAYLKGIGVAANRVETEIEDYLSAFSPFSMQMTDKIKKNTGNTTVTDEVAARLSSYDQGKVGTGRVYYGTDLESGYHCFEEFKRNATKAENILIAAETGGGKSFYAKVLILQLLADPRFNGTIMDIEGDEYIPILNFLGDQEKVALLNMAEGQGNYLDPVEVYVTGDKVLDQEMYSTAVSCTKSILAAIADVVIYDDKGGVGKSERGPLEYSLETVLDVIIGETYKKFRVVADDPRTWGRSSQMRIHDMYKTLLKLNQDIKRGKFPDNHPLNYLTNEVYQAPINLLIGRLSVYLSEGGARSNLFRNRINLRSVADAKLVICSFGMRGKDYATVDKTQMVLAQIYSARISHLRSLMSKQAGKFNFKVWEEFQRFMEFPGAISTINTALTGGRKLGDVNIINTNRLGILLKADDRMGIFENITSWAIGAIRDSQVREDFCRRKSVEHLLDTLDLIPAPEQSKVGLSLGENEEMSDEEIDEQEEDVAKSKYSKSFLTQFNNKEPALVKLKLPASVAESDLLRTGVKVSSNVESGISERLDW